MHGIPGKSQESQVVKCPHCGGMHRVGAKFCPVNGMVLGGNQVKKPVDPAREKIRTKISAEKSDSPELKDDETNEMGLPAMKRRKPVRKDVTPGVPSFMCPGCDILIPIAKKTKFCNNCGRLLEELSEKKSTKSSELSKSSGKAESSGGWAPDARFPDLNTSATIPYKNNISPLPGNGLQASGKPDKESLSGKPTGKSSTSSTKTSTRDALQDSLKTPSKTTPKDLSKTTSKRASGTISPKGAGVLGKQSGKSKSLKQPPRRVFCPYSSCGSELAGFMSYCPSCYRRVRICVQCKTLNPLKEEKCTSCKTPIPSQDPSDWLMFKGNPERTGNSSQVIQPELVLRWKYPERKQESRIVSSPLVCRGMVYYGSSDNHIHAVNQYTGDSVWKRPTNGFVLSTPAIWGDTLYAASCDGRVYAQDVERGKPVWVYPRKTAYFLGKITSPLLACKSGVIIASDNGVLVCLEHSNGHKKWRREFDVSQLPDELNTEDHPFFGGIAWGEGKLFVAGRDGKIYCLNAETGKDVWKFPREGKNVSAFVSTPAYAAGHCYAADRAGKLYAVDKNGGTDSWNFTVDVDGVVEGSPSIGFGRIILGTQNQYLVALDLLAGGEAWRERNEKIRLIDAIFSTPTITFNQLAFVGSNSGYVYCRDVKNGDEIWKYKLDSPIRSAPAVSDGFLYVTTSGGFLYAFCEKRIRTALESPDINT